MSLELHDNTAEVTQQTREEVTPGHGEQAAEAAAEAFAAKLRDLGYETIGSPTGVIIHGDSGGDG